MGDPKPPGCLKVPASVLSTESTIIELKLKTMSGKTEIYPLYPTVMIDKDDYIIYIMEKKT